MKKSDWERVHHKEERWDESSPIEKERWVRVDHEKKGDGVRVHHEKKSDGCEFTMRDKAMG